MYCTVWLTKLWWYNAMVWYDMKFNNKNSQSSQFHSNTFTPNWSWKLANICLLQIVIHVHEVQNALRCSSSVLEHENITTCIIVKGELNHSHREVGTTHIKFPSQACYNHDQYILQVTYIVFLEVLKVPENTHPYHQIRETQQHTGWVIQRQLL